MNKNKGCLVSLFSLNIWNYRKFGHLIANIILIKSLDKFKILKERISSLISQLS